MNMPEKVTEASLAIHWRPHFYRTAWFFAMCALLILAGVFTFYRLRLRQVHDRFEAVLEERNRIAREMHDTVIQGCVSASALLEAVVSLDPHSSGELRELLDTARNQVRATVDEARRAVWNLRQRETASPEICHLLEQMAHQVGHASKVPVRFKTFGSPVHLDQSVEYVLLMVAREAVSNAVHHAQPREVRIEVKYEAEKVRMQVQDDGNGFDVEEILAIPGAHFGIIGMRERIEHVGGSFEIVSGPGKGTRLTMEVPARAPVVTKSLEIVKV
jgi:signal transduction histidine kinase